MAFSTWRIPLLEWRGRCRKRHRRFIKRSMLIPTGRDLECLATLYLGWKMLYLAEVARLLKEEDNICDALPERPSTERQSRPWNVFPLNCVRLCAGEQGCQGAS
jgi:hypothetical protein